MLVLLLILLDLAVTVAGAAWGLMLAIGVVHADWLVSMPTMDYGTAFAVALCLRLPFVLGEALGGGVAGAIE